MTILASRASRVMDVARHIVLRDYQDGLEAGDGAILEAPVLFNPRFHAGLIEAVLHVVSVDAGGGDVWLDILSRAHPPVDVGRRWLKLLLLRVLARGGATMSQKSVTSESFALERSALEAVARRQLLGGCWRRSWTWLVARKRYRATLAAIKAASLHRTVLQAQLSLWLAELRRQVEARS